ncbi:hypothetical protein DESA109040_22145 [Deinococcus saxicola]
MVRDRHPGGPAGVPRVPLGAARPEPGGPDRYRGAARRVLRGLANGERHPAGRRAGAAQEAPGDGGQHPYPGRPAGRTRVCIERRRYRDGRRRAPHRLPARPATAAHARGHHLAQRIGAVGPQERQGPAQTAARRVAGLYSGAAVSGRRGLSGRAGHADLPESPGARGGGCGRPGGAGRRQKADRGGLPGGLHRGTGGQPGRRHDHPAGPGGRHQPADRPSGHADGQQPAVHRGAQAGGAEPGAGQKYPQRPLDGAGQGAEGGRHADQHPGRPHRLATARGRFARPARPAHSGDGQHRYQR